MTYNCTYTVPDNHILTIPIPQGFPSNHKVIISIEESDEVVDPFAMALSSYEQGSIEEFVPMRLFFP